MFQENPKVTGILFDPVTTMVLDSATVVVVRITKHVPTKKSIDRVIILRVVDDRQTRAFINGINQKGAVALGGKPVCGLLYEFVRSGGLDFFPGVDAPCSFTVFQPHAMPTVRR